MKYPTKPTTKSTPEKGQWRYTANGMEHLVTDVGNWSPQGEGYPLPIYWGNGRSGFARTNIKSSRGLIPWGYCVALADLLTKEEYEAYRALLAGWHRENATHYTRLAHQEDLRVKELEKPL